MADVTGEAKEPLRVAFDRRLKLEFHGARITSDGGLLAYRELDDALGLTAMAMSALAEGRRGKNTRHRLLGLLRQAVYGRLAGYEDVNDAERLARDPAMRAIVGREGLDRPAGPGHPRGRPRPARWAASRPSGSQPRRTWRHSPPCPARGSTGCTNAGRPTASSSTWIAPRARPLGSRKARPGTATSAARATTRCSSSTSSATSNAACSGPATSIAPTTGARCWCR